MIFGVRSCRRMPNYMKKTRVAKVLPQSAPKIVFLLQFDRKLGSPEGGKTRHGGRWAQPFYDFFGFGCQRAERSLPKAHHEAKKYQKVPKSTKHIGKVLEIC